MVKRLVVCCDGTWNFADQPSKTNVTKVALSVSRCDGDIEQRVYYGSGVGTRRWEHLRGGAFGVGLSHDILDAYRFLVDNYEPADQLYLFGFSRGAFTARSLAGLVRNSGILREEYADQFKKAWALYRNRTEKPTSTASTLFRRAYSHETGIRFIGVWDTVGSLGIPVPEPRWLATGANVVNRRWAFHDTELSSWVEGAFHALAIDERRGPFRPTLWHQQPGATYRGPVHSHMGEDSQRREQELKQVWFTGVHCDIGGGYQETALSDITLLWMVGHARKYGLKFDDAEFQEAAEPTTTSDESAGFKVRPDALGTLHDSRKGLYKLVPPVSRSIGEAKDGDGRPDGREYLSETANQRYDLDPSYKPSSLSSYRKGQEIHLDVATAPSRVQTD
jgi:uncharacterized protein (DUF2235 family)